MGLAIVNEMLSCCGAMTDWLERSACNVKSVGSSLGRGSCCSVRTLSKSFTHNCSALLMFRRMPYELLNFGNRAISNAVVLLYYNCVQYTRHWRVTSVIRVAVDYRCPCLEAPYLCASMLPISAEELRLYSLPVTISDRLSQPSTGLPSIDGDDDPQRRSINGHRRHRRHFHRATMRFNDEKI